MRNLRAKLLFGFGGLMLLLVVVSALSIGVISWYSQAIDKVLHENYDSVVYGLKMLDAIEQLNTCVTSNQAPCLALPDEAWDEPLLLSECPRCHKLLKFNPFIVDNRERC